MESLATAVLQQLSTHQTNTEQIMAVHWEHIDASLERLCLSTKGPHYKRQKYGYEANADADVMEDADALW
eukprot:14553137-Ditylum_brightwellii.AAC.1